MTETSSPDRLRGEGEMARRTAAHDWSATPLGPIESWPQSLKTAVDIVLGSGHAMQLAWGSERTILYNDAYAPMLGACHPDGSVHWSTAGAASSTMVTASRSA